MHILVYRLASSESHFYVVTNLYTLLCPTASWNKTTTTRTMRLARALRGIYTV